MLIAVVVLAVAGLLAAKETERSGSAPPQAVEPAKSAEGAVDGDLAYKANCSRCHLAPRKFPERKAATIMMHMRVRSNLTEAQTQAILRYLTE
jgi:mono/diheme cytochrome c family protein